MESISKLIGGFVTSLVAIQQFLTSVVQDNEWLIDSIAIICFTWLVYYIWRKINRKLIHQSSKKGYTYSEIFWRASRRSVGLLILVFGAISCCMTPLLETSPELHGYLNIVRHLVVIGVASWLMLKIIGDVEQKVTVGDIVVANKTRFSTILNASKLIVMFLTFALVLQAFGYSLAGLAAVGSVSAIVLGFASKTWIENVLGFATIRTNKKYLIGDLIEIEDLEIIGFVESITISSTNIRDLQTKLVSVPNGLFLTKHVNNIAKMTHRQVKFDLPVGIEDVDKISGALKIVKKCISQDERVANKKRILCNIKDYDLMNGFMIVRVDFYLNTTQLEKFYNERQEMFIKIMDALTRTGIALSLRKIESLEQIDDLDDEVGNNNV